MGLRQEATGDRGVVALFVRENDRCPGAEFLDGCQPQMCKRFRDSFNAVVRMGASYVNDQRFKPLKSKGKPLWEFKEHDHRLYCARATRPDERVEIVIFNGWVKDKKGKAKEEAREIKKAKDLYEEFRFQGRQ